MKLSAVVIAAGLSRRMGREKILLRFAGETVLGRVLSTLASAGISEPIVVLRPDLQQAIEIARAAGARVVINPRPEEEMLLSVRMGMVEVSPGTDAFYVWPADHPAVAAHTLDSLARQGQRARVALPLHAGRRGHPALIGSDLVGDIARIPEGEGLRHLWRARPEALVEVPVDDAGTLLDLDTPEDYDRALQSLPHPPR